MDNFSDNCFHRVKSRFCAFIFSHVFPVRNTNLTLQIPNHKVLFTLASCITSRISLCLLRAVQHFLWVLEKIWVTPSGFPLHWYVRTMTCLRFLPAYKVTGEPASFMDAERRHKMLVSETEDCLAESNWRSQRGSICVTLQLPQEMWRGPGSTFAHKRLHYTRWTLSSGTWNISRETIWNRSWSKGMSSYKWRKQISSLWKK